MIIIKESDDSNNDNDNVSDDHNNYNKYNNSFNAFTLRGLVTHLKSKLLRGDDLEHLR